jgi:hypothetical protein
MVVSVPPAGRPSGRESWSGVPESRQDDQHEQLDSHHPRQQLTARALD